MEKTTVVGAIVLKGNVKTKPYILMREITFNQGDTLQYADLMARIAQSRENLLNTPLFNFVDFSVDTIAGTTDQVAVSFSVTERWYIWPYPIVEVADRNFNAWWRAQNLSRLNFGGYVVVENFRGRLERLKLLVKGGFDQKFQIEYYRPYLNQRHTLGLLAQAEFMGNHEVAASTNALNDVVFIKDENDWIRTFINLNLTLVYRPGIHNSHELGAGWSANFAGDTLRSFSSALWPNRHEQYLTLRYQFKHDRRDYRHYPLNGRYIDFSIGTSLPIQATSRHNPFHEAEGNIRFYGPIAPRFWWGAGLYGRLTSQNPVSYYLMQGLGNSRYFVRGYEYYLIDGQQTMLARSNVVFSLIKPSEKRLPHIRSDKFGRLHYAVYLRAFADYGITRNTIDILDSRLNNQWLGGCGLGCDLVTYYDKVLRVEYSVNRLGESGWFIHFMASI